MLLNISMTANLVNLQFILIGLKQQLTKINNSFTTTMHSWVISNRGK